MLVLATAGLAACTSAPPAEDRAAQDSAAITPPAVAAPTARAAQQSAADTAWTLRPDGIGPVRVGMTPDEARAALGGDFAVAGDAAAGSTCEYARAGAAPAGVLFMVDGGRVARVDVRDSSTVATREGARVGDTEARVKELYGASVDVQPHKYVQGGHNLVVTPAGGDGRLRLVFETDGQRVTRFRGGTTPQVEFVEGCS